MWRTRCQQTIPNITRNWEKGVLTQLLMVYSGLSLGFTTLKPQQLVPGGPPPPLPILKPRVGNCLRGCLAPKGRQAVVGEEQKKGPWNIVILCEWYLQCLVEFQVEYITIIWGESIWVKQLDAFFSLHMRTTVFCQQFNVNERIWGITLNVWISTRLQIQDAYR